jgi:hypothetical protein
MSTMSRVRFSSPPVLSSQGQMPGLLRSNPKTPQVVPISSSNSSAPTGKHKLPLLKIAFLVIAGKLLVNHFLKKYGQEKIKLPIFKMALLALMGKLLIGPFLKKYNQSETATSSTWLPFGLSSVFSKANA